MKLFFILLCGCALTSSFVVANTQTGYCKDCSCHYDNCGCADDNDCACKDCSCTGCPCSEGSDRGQE